VVAALLALPAPAGAQQRGGVFDVSRLPAATADLVQAETIPAGFTESAAISGLTNPTAVRFAPDGRVVVAEKRGLVKEFDSLSDTTPTVLADLRTEVDDFWDRGLLDLALDPNFTVNGTFYVLYSYDKEPGNPQVPRWGDACPTPPGATNDGCVISGRLSRISAAGVETPLIEGWCQQYPSHSVGSLAFGPDGALYVSGGDGASFNWPDYGQDGNPVNPCGDPPGAPGTALTPPTAEGGSLRSQDLQTPGDPTGLNGAILRVNPATGAAMAGNPNIASPDLNARRIVAYGFRNPFRITVRPGTNEVWAGDVGSNDWEEIDQIQNPVGSITNYGWPCYEGADNGRPRTPAFDSLDLSICENLYTPGDTKVVPPFFTYNHAAHVVKPTDACPTGGSSISGLAFYPAGGSFGNAYQGALFFSDYSRNCIWVMTRGGNGLPDPATRQVFAAGAAGPVDLQVGPDGDLFYVDMLGGTIRRIRGSASVQMPTARASADPTGGAPPLTVQFDGRGSSDPQGRALTYAWDLDGDGQFDDSNSATPTYRYDTAGVVTVGLRVANTIGSSDVTSVRIVAGTPPTVAIDAPSASTTWAVGDAITFSGHSNAASLSWQINLRHCSPTNPSSCHTHVVESRTGSGGSFIAPDHEYPSHLELQLTATGSNGLTNTATRELQPKTVPITLGSQPAGAELTLGAQTLTAPFTLDAIQRSQLSITAPATLGGAPFSSWSDGGARTHGIVAGTGPATYTARFAGQPAAPRVTATPSVLNFTAIAGAPNPAPKHLTVAGPDLRVSAAASWLSVARAGSVVTVSAKAAGLKPGTYRTTVEVSSPGLTPVDVPVKLRVKPHTTGLVGAWGFDETHGRTARDASRLHDAGRISGATRTKGRHGGALSFDGRNDRVTVAGAKGLDLKRMTLEAWVRLRRSGSRRAVLVKGEASLRAGALRRNRWSHVALTWDGAVRRLYVNGKLVATAPLTAVKSRGPLRIGGDPVRHEWFRGRIDDVRVYNRALSGAEIALDRGTRVG
jgi:glucose/arabinose dehydrogenase/PKD repeat protein